MDDTDREELFYKLYRSSTEHLHRVGYKDKASRKSGFEEIRTSFALACGFSRFEKGHILNLLYKRSIHHLQNCSVVTPSPESKKIEATKSLQAITPLESITPSINKESVEVQTPLRGTLILGISKKKLFHPDVEPDNIADTNEEGCGHVKGIASSRKKRTIARIKPIRDLLDEIRTLKSSVESSDLMPKQSLKRKRNEDDYPMRNTKIMKLDSFQPKACSTPILKQPLDNLSLRPRVVETNWIRKLLPTKETHTKQKTKEARFIPIEEISHSEDVITSSPQFNIQRTGHEDDNQPNVSEASERNKVDESDDDDDDDDDNVTNLNRTFTLPLTNTSPPKSTSTQTLPIIATPNKSKTPPAPTSSPATPPSKVPLRTRLPKPAGNTTTSKLPNRTSTRLISKSVNLVGPSSTQATLTAELPKVPETTSQSSEESIVSPSDPKENKIVEMLDWCILEDEMSFVLSGYVRNPANKKFDKINCTIASRQKSKLIEVSDGKIYKLIKSFVKSRSNLADVAQYFKNGFPENWKEILNGAVEESKIKKMPATTSEKRPKDLKKPKSLLNTSFFDLPEGKGTVETPLSTEDLRQTRKSGRHVVPPLAFWKNQRVFVDPKTNETSIIDGCKNFLDTKIVHFKH